MPLPVSHLGVATLLLVLASVADVWKRRIPNPLNAILALEGVWAQASSRGWVAMLQALCAGVLTVALLWVPWMKGRLGGGDVKMAGGAAVWVGLGLWPEYLVFTALAGGIVGVICYAFSTRPAQRAIRDNLAAAAAGQGLAEAPLKGGGRLSVPYGVAVAMGSLVILWKGGGW